MKFAQTFIKHHVMTILLYILVVVFGFYSFQNLPLALMPSMEVPAAVVYATYPGAGPEDIEQQVTKKLEGAVAGLSGLDTLQSTSSENMAMLVIQFTNHTDMDQAMTDLRDKVAQVKSQLPDDASDPTVMSIDIDSMPVVQVALRGNDLASLQSIAEDEIQPALERLDGVASVDISGGYEQEIAVHTDASRLKGYNLTISSIGQQLGADNIAIPGGELDNGSQTLAVRTDGEYSSIDDVKNALISLPAGGTVRLSQIADVSMRPKDQDAISKVDGEECIILSVNKQSGSNTAQIAELAKTEFDSLLKSNDSLQWNIVMDQSDYINMTVDNAIQNIWMGVLFAAIVLFLFLRDFGATMAVTIAMPCCILFTFLIMNVLGITLNMMSLGGITLGVGMIVDNSIVVLENIFTYRADGYDRMDACTKGTGEVIGAVIASTLTTVAVFLPIALSGGMAGMMFKEFCITIVALLLSSLIISITLVPLLCYFLLGGTKQKSVKPQGSGATPITEKPLSRVYRSSLNFLITHRWAGIALTVVICIVSVLSVSQAGMELIPEMDEGQVSVTVSMPNGSTMEDTAAIEDRIAAIAVDTIPELEQIYYSTGSSTSIMSSSSGANVTISLVDLDQRDRSSADIAKQLRRDLQDIAGCELTVSTSSTMSMSTDSDISVELTGDDYDQLAETADDLANRISALPDAINVESSAGEQTPRVAVKINRENASRFGLNAATIGGLVRGELTGSTATTLRMNGEEYDVTVAGDEDVATSLDALRSMQIPTMTGGTVPLSMVADVYTELSPQSIVRKNQKETVTITGESESGDSNAIQAAVDKVVADYELPDGVEVGSGDTAASQIAETTGTLMLALAVAIVLVYFILATQFNSFSLPIAIMLILPIGLLGSMIMLWPTGNHVSMVALLGVIILAGTVVNSSIVLIDYTLQRRQRGEDKNTAILNACPRRVRPVLMTAMTTILGLVPMVCSSGEGSEMMKPMGVVMMTGMVISTIATLFITPVYYSLTDSVAARLSGLFKKIKLPKFNFHKKNPQQ
ncbi:AcrB/AcrD/AcrF family protein [Butyricicoccus sp. AF35-5AC]|jgi:hydrophobe/amphiphile efflux-1 (HAE1) family protein|uniref:efflux RND transporter permease subunit n=1 Tax=Butyricicoccus sp. AF35-5AC TaxID=2292003 RepID=UPI000E4E0921|nr:efflux RND transporter permease subunit [Butyricicoccus sp. AF35-5AC]RHP12003.1 AcrB/AcrD/AcrF family protein [Butyricicoccus sp. AF35-5AC]